MARVIFSKTINKENQVVNYLNEIKDNNPNLLIMIKHSILDMELAKDYPVGEYKPYLVDREYLGKKTQFELIKKLSEPRIFELRVDHNKEYHRFIYFPYIYQDEQCYIFIYGFEKVKGKPDFTNYYMKQAKILYDFLRKNGNENHLFEG